MNNPRIVNWHLRGMGGPYDAPETQQLQVSGQVFGSQKFQDGKRITTSHLVAISGCEIETFSGNIYMLGRPDGAYMEWCRKKGCHIPTPDEPIKL